jgi:hypothetical protein
MLKLTGPDLHAKLDQKLHLRFGDFIRELSRELTINPWPIPEVRLFQAALKNPSLANHKSGESFLFVTECAKLGEIIVLLEDLADDPQDSDLSQAVFDFWDASDLSGDLFKLLAKKLLILEAGLELLQKRVSRLLAFYALHLARKPQLFQAPLPYPFTPEMGETPRNIVIGQSAYEFQNPQESSIRGIDKQGLPLTDQKLVPIAGIQAHLPKIISLNVITGLEIFQKTREKQKARIELALERINQAAPELVKLLSHYTKTIIPINDSGIVSFSQQNFPSYSSINLFERDDIDLMDDLLHENGHHILNAFLNLDELIIEDEEKIFYSPWRRALRPVRGIYHAYATFYWALELFCKLHTWADGNSESGLSLKHRVKIASRAIEEFHMLKFCEPDLILCRAMGKITAKGEKIINLFREAVAHKGQQVAEMESWLKLHSANDFKQLKILSDELKKKRQHYQLEGR